MNFGTPAKGSCAIAGISAVDLIRIALTCSSVDREDHSSEEKGFGCSSNLSAAIAARPFVRWVLDALSCLSFPCFDETQPDSVDRRPTFLCATANYGVLTKLFFCRGDGKYNILLRRIDSVFFHIRWSLRLDRRPTPSRSKLSATLTPFSHSRK